MSYSEWDACVEAGLDLWAWETGIYPKDFRVRVMAFIGLKHLVDLHSQDALARAMHNKQRHGRGRR